MSRSAAALLAFALSAAAAPWVRASGAPETEVRSVVDTGHAGSVRDLGFDASRGLLFSAGDDGTVRVWETDGTLSRKLQVSQLAAESIAVNPVAPQVAAVVSDGTGSHFLAVWDWEKERPVFQQPLHEQPLFLRFSAAGTYLMYGESSWQSLHVLRASDWAAVPFHPEGFGIVAFAELSRSEKTIMTYLVSGRLAYWDLASGQQSLDLPCVPYLTSLRMSSDRRWLVGSTSREIVLVDALTGSVKSRAALEGAASLDVSPTSDEVACISAGGRITRYAITPDGLQPEPGLPRAPAPISLLRWADDALLAAEPDGSLHRLSPAGEDVKFGKDALARLTGLDAAHGMVALGSPDWVRVFATDLLTGARTPTFIRSLSARGPFGAASALSFVAGAKLLAWRADGGPPALSQLDVSSLSGPGSASGAFQPMPSAFKTPLVDMRSAGADALLGIGNAGLIQLTDQATGTSRFELRVPGAGSVVAVSATELVVGRNAAAAPGGSLLRVNTRTGETVSLADRNAFTYGLAFGAPGPTDRPQLYSVGVDAAGATNLVLHEGSLFEKDSLLASVPEEDLDVSLALDPDTRVLYATLGRDRVVSWDGRQAKSVVLENAAPRRLVARDGLLYSLNKDSTVTVSDSATGASLAEIYLFSDGEWCTLFRDGRYAASTGGDIHVKVYADGAPVKATEEYRLRIEGE